MPMDRAQKVDENMESFILFTPRVTVIKMSETTYFCIFC